MVTNTKTPQPTEKRIKNTGTTKAFGDNGGSRPSNKTYRNNFEAIDWSKK